jgi:hypothetical protein
LSTVANITYTISEARTTSTRRNSLACHYFALERDASYSSRRRPHQCSKEESSKAGINTKN